ncbi:MAG TPA: exopolysaccharide biosynthesis protein [Verrucomicrobiae bacterium]|jgi:hypothetical protein
MHHALLSKDLEEILREEKRDRALTLNQMMQRTEGRGFYLLMILFSLPFLAPVSVPGLSCLMGPVILILALRLAMRLPARLPRFIGERPFDPKRMSRVLQATIKVVRLIEKLVRPRKTSWMRWRAVQAHNALVIAVMALLLALPLSVLPFTNTLPSYAIILLAVSMMEEDGVTIWIGYAASTGTVVYFVSIAEVLSRLYARYYHQLKAWFFSLL